MRAVVLILGLVGVLLGGLWLVQGLGIMHIRPIFCVAECTPVEGPSVTWAVTGAVMLVAGVLALTHVRRPR